MSEAARKTEHNPEGYSPKDRPAILSLVKEFSRKEIDNMVKNHAVELVGMDYIDLPATRFIGIDVKGGPKEFGEMWGRSGEFMPVLDGMQEYATVLTDPCALMHFSNRKHDEPGGEMHYIIGQFMKADALIPEGFDHWDIPSVTIGLGVVYGEFNEMIEKAMNMVYNKLAADGYEATYPDPYFHAEVYVRDNVPQDGVISKLGYLHACRKKK